MRVDGYGFKDNKKSGIRYEVVEKYDDKTQFMAMEKWTGWHASIVMQKIMDGTIKSGAYPIEKALSGNDFYNEIIKRNYNIKFSKIN
jgi:saccharopine dehydrogenase-like NADP-dependent oxidoreductase